MNSLNFYKEFDGSCKLLKYLIISILNNYKLYRVFIYILLLRSI